MQKSLLASLILAPALLSPNAMANSGCGFEENQSGLFATCAQPKHEEVILTGALEMENIKNAIPGYSDNYEVYQPQQKWVSRIAEEKTATEIVVIIGTWCPDCHRETPRFAKLIDAAANNNIQMRYIGVDRQKSDPDNLSKAYDFKRIPTFIVMQEGKEIGRIVESPKTTLEQDLANILN